MFATILFPTDLSQRAETLLDCIAGIPQVKEIILLHVVKETRHPMGAPGVEALAKKKAGKALHAAKDYLASLNPAIRVTPDTLVAADVADGILASAEKHRADLIVIAAEQKEVRAGILLGSVPSTLLCRVSRPNILIMRHRIIENLQGTTYEKFCPRIFSKILCPTHFSEFSEHATGLTGMVPGAGEIILFHSVPEGTTPEETADAVRQAEARLEKARDSLAAQGARCRAVVRTGDPAAAIMKAAEEEDVSVIWISSFGKGCIREFLLGSVAQDVAMNAARPVIVIRSWQ